MEQDDKIQVIISKDGYILNRDGAYSCFRQDIPFGGIVFEVLNTYYGNPECNKTNTVLPSAFPMKIRKALQPVHRIGAVLTTPIIEKLPELITDRDSFITFMNDENKNKHLFPLYVSEKQTWNSTMGGERELYIREIADLLLYDISKVIELNIYIKQCAYCGEYFFASSKRQKYCRDHMEAGANKARIEKRKNDRCEQLVVRITARLYERSIRTVGDYSGSIRYENEYNEFLKKNRKWKTAYTAGEITEQEYYTLLKEVDETDRKYKKHKK